MALMKKSEVIRLAEGCKWRELRILIEKNPTSAQERDRFGMIPLHWACTDPKTPQDVLMLLLKAYPAGARMLNSGKMLPLHIAIKAQASVEWLQALLANYPEAAVALTPANEDVVTLAKKYKLPSVSLHLLEEMRDHVQKTGYRSGSHTTEEDVEDYDEMYRPDSVFGTSTRLDAARSNSTASARTFDSFSSDQHHSLHMTPIEIDDHPSHHSNSAGNPYAPNRSIVSLPPRWTNALNCHICYSKFSTFKKRHHCRNCGQSICTDHSAKSKLKLPHFGLTARQRVCVICHDSLTSPATLHGNMLPQMSTEPMMMSSQRGSVPMSSSRSMRPLTSQNSLQVYAYQQPPQPQLLSQRSYPPPHDKDSVIEDMNLQVQLLQQQVNKLMEEKTHAEALLLRHTGSSDTQQKLSNEEQPVETTSPQPEPETDRVRPSWEVPRETSLTDHDIGRDTYADVQYDYGRDSRYTLDDRDTFFEKYLSRASSGGFIPEATVVEEEEEEELIEAEIIVTPEEDEHEDDIIQEVDTLVTLGMAMLQKGSTSGAVAAFERAVEVMPRDPLLRAYLGKACYADEDLERAVIEITKSLELEPSAANWTLLGKMLFEKGDHDRAIQAYQKSLEIQKRQG